MEILVEHRPGSVRVIVQGPKDSAQLMRVLALLRADGQKLWVWDEERACVALSPGEVVWAEMVEGRCSPIPPPPSTRPP